MYARVRIDSVSKLFAFICLWQPKKKKKEKKKKEKKKNFDTISSRPTLVDNVANRLALAST
jgi:hypothetical protein